MSVRAMSEVWSRELPPRVILTALALADHADHEGRNAFPSVELLAWKTRSDRRTVQRHLRILEGLGFIYPAGYAKGGHGRTTRYHFAFEKVPAKPAYETADGPRDTGGDETGRAAK